MDNFFVKYTVSAFRQEGECINSIHTAFIQLSTQHEISYQDVILAILNTKPFWDALSGSLIRSIDDIKKL